jgi:protein dithiol oxidoreductase (disulfide-forming)
MLKKAIQTLFIGVALFGAVGAHAAVEGKDYKKMATPQAVADASRMEVIEFFWYGCSHCYTIEPVMAAWAQKLPKDVNYRRVHVVWPGRSDLEGHARLFLALQAMGLESKYALSVFSAIQRERLELRREKTLFDWVQKQGIDLGKFKAAYNGFSVSMQLNAMAKMTQDYGIDGVPAIIVNGKWVTGPSVHGREDATITRVIDEMLDAERKSRQKKK